MKDALKNEELKREAAARVRKNMGRTAKLDERLEKRFDEFLQKEWLKQPRLIPGGSARAKSPAMIKTLLLEEAIGDLLKKYGR